MIKRIFSVVITLAIILCIVFECSLNASAIVVADDALVIASVVLACAGAGLTIYSWSEFFQSDNWRYFCLDVAGDISSGFSMIVKNGKRYVSLVRDKWNSVCNWISSKFSGKSGDVDVSYETPSHPTTITLNDGSTAPYAEWMGSPFFIYKATSGNIWGITTSGTNPGVNLMNRTYRVLCNGRGIVSFHQLVNGSWSGATDVNMTFGVTYRGNPGSYYDIELAYQSGYTTVQATLYRTMEFTTDSGSPNESSPPDQIPVTEGTSIIQGHINENKLPEAVDGPTATLAEGEQMIIEIPDDFLETVETQEGQVTQITTDVESLVDAVNGLSSYDVRPKVMTNPASASATVEQIITNTVESELDTDSPNENVQTDTDIADKFRLPKSFLEGFPFSIPYSIYLGLQSFVADPEAPSFDLPFSIPRLGIDETVRLDLSQFNPLARLCRAFLSLVWVAGLAMACNAWIKR